MAKSSAWAPARAPQVYRRISVQMHADQKYMALSPVKPSGRSLWEYLQHGPHTGVIPGLSRIGRAAMSEELGWDQDDFNACFDEIRSLDMARWDFQARLLFLKNAVRHNLPTSPNVILSWRNQWAILPECALKEEAREFIRSVLKQELSEAFVEAFDKACPKPKAKAFDKPSDKVEPKTCDNQEQEQEQEQDSPSPSLRSGDERGDGNFVAEAEPNARGPDASAEDLFWAKAPAMDAIGIRRSQLGELAKLLNGDFDRALSILDDAAGAKKPSTYFGAIVRNLRAELGGGAVVPINAADRSAPAWVLNLRNQGEAVTKDGDRWRWAGTLYDDDQRVVGW